MIAMISGKKLDLTNTKAIAIRPDFAEAWYSRGNALNKDKRFREVIDSFDKAIEINPDDTETWLSRGIVLDELDRHPEHAG
jgi:tetratricopeptide (TPR) repeat protein